ncbi:nitrilase-related carbon-nitrogen hydrolase [Stratiformator vulcanicus]|uniref:(R)-stereoselective amidase n=1 Tax=Stratiformator vulcanicus TaxID=2527980 RepID=A0A517QX82_9PLAN|nr:nitrilase-related carbon-nitrogen hydrolase [Stratiformator vulcanicus]QDT36265.1 (R)-stereoselective amidase [Stratiformator vulcanicus]
MTEPAAAKRPPVLKVGVAQVESIPFEIEHNVDTHFRMIEEAKSQGVDLLVFPELSITGYHVGFRAPEVSMRRDDPLLIGMAEEAGDMAVVVGFVEEGFAAQIHNSAAVLNDGKVQFVHRKLNLASYGNLDERRFYAGGRYFDVFNHHAPWMGAVLICADMWNPGLVHLAALYGTTILISPIASSERALGGGFSNPKGWENVTQFYAMIYGIPIVMANLSGDAVNDDHFWGGSRIVDPYGNVLVRAEGGEQLLIADLDYQAVRDARFRLPTVRDSNLDLITREINRLNSRIGVPGGMRSK